jgi:hypothetical protein
VTSHVTSWGMTRRRGQAPQTINVQLTHTGAGMAQWYSAGIRVVWLGVRVPVGAGNFSLHQRVQTGSGAHQASYPTGTRALSLGVKRGRGVKLTTHLHLVPRSRMRRDIPSLPQYAFMAWCSVKKNTQGQIYLCVIQMSVAQ